MSSLESASTSDSPPSLSVGEIWTPKRRELREWFQKAAPPLAPAYEGAVSLLATQNLVGRAHFVAHAVRDIMNGLCGVLEQRPSSRQVDYVHHVNKIEKDWPNLEKLFDPTTPSSAEQPILIAAPVVKLVNELVIEHREGSRRSKQTALALKYLAKDDSTARVSPRTIEEFERTRKWFNACAHFRRESRSTVDIDQLHSYFDVFETILLSFVGNFFTIAKELDGDLQQANE